MSIVTSNANLILGHLFGDDTYTLPANYYVGVSTTTPTVTGTNITEPTGLGYARVAVPNTTAYWNTASARAVTNKLDIEFAQSSGDWGTVTYLIVFDALSGGSAMYYNSISPRQVYSETTLSFPADSLTISIP